MSCESVCQVARNWVDVGSFHTRLFGVVYFAIASVREFLDTSSYVRDILARSRNVYTSSAVLTAYLPFHAKIARLWRFIFAGDSKTYLGLQVHCPILLPDVKQNRIFSTDFHSSPPGLNFTNFRPQGATLIPADVTKVIGALGGYANAPKNWFILDSMRGNVCVRKGTPGRPIRRWKYVSNNTGGCELDSCASGQRPVAGSEDVNPLAKWY
jgi:hypothetical protein